jgi:hypothetical protein
MHWVWLLLIAVVIWYFLLGLNEPVLLGRGQKAEIQ